MLRFLRRRRALDDFIDAVRPELTSLPTPEPTRVLRDRILASRAAGVRTILPDVPQHRRMPSRIALGFALAAAIVVLLVPLELRRASSGAGDIASPGVFGHAAFAESVRDPRKTALEPVQVSVPGTLRAMSLEFERRVADTAGRATATTRITLDVSPGQVDGSDAWRVVHVDNESQPTPRVSVETVYVARADLHLLRRTIHTTPYSRFQRINLWQQFRGDSISGRMNTEGPSIGAGRTFARQLPRAFAPFLTESVAPVFFSGVQLHRDWRGSASLLGWAVRDDDVLLPIELRVVGEETVTVPAGAFACWRLSLRFSGRRIDYWTRKSDGLGVRMLDTSAVRTKETREIVLTRISQ